MVNGGSFKIRKKYLTDWRLSLLALINNILIFFNLRQTEMFWGIIYDSVTKQPLDPVVVKLVYTDGREVETCVTDLGGKYGFLADAGKFKILAHRTNYAFPSRHVGDNTDVIYDKPYKGEFFVLDKDSEVVAPNIPMDPENFDWNQKAKQKVIVAHPYTILFFRKLMGVLFWFGFIYLLICLWHFYPKLPVYFSVILGVYTFIILCAGFLAEPRLWGQLKTQKNQIDPQGWVLELYSLQFPDIRFGKAVVHGNGKFLLRANPGKFLLTLSRTELNGGKTILARRPVIIGNSGVLNSTFVLQT